MTFNLVCRSFVNCIKGRHASLSTHFKSDHSTLERTWRTRWSPFLSFLIPPLLRFFFLIPHAPLYLHSFFFSVIIPSPTFFLLIPHTTLSYILSSHPSYYPLLHSFFSSLILPSPTFFLFISHTPLSLHSSFSSIIPPLPTFCLSSVIFHSSTFYFLKILSSQKRGGYRGVPVDSS
jgi:hypothetical protein